MSSGDNAGIIFFCFCRRQKKRSLCECTDFFIVSPCEGLVASLLVQYIQHFNSAFAYYGARSEYGYGAGFI